MAGNTMNILVLSDNPEVLARAKPIFEKRKVTRWTFTNSDDINPKKDFKHIIDNYELVFSLHCKKIFPKVLTDAVRCVNIHPGYNPYNRGVFPHVFSIVNGLPAGVTIHEMTEEIDNGPFYLRSQVQIFPNDTSTTLYERVIDTEMRALDHILPDIINNKCQVYFTDPDDGKYNSMEDFKKLCKFSPAEVGNFDYYFNKMRALSHTGYLNAHMNGIKFKLIIANENPNPENDKG